jgi:hypothetical protein
MDGFAEFLSWRVFTERDLGAVQLNFFLKGFHTHTHTHTQMGIAKLLIECFQRDERWVLLSFLLEGFSHRER